MAPHQLGARLPTVAVLDAVASSRPTGSGGDCRDGSLPVPVRELHGFSRAGPFDRLQRLGPLEPVSGAALTEQLPGAVLRRPRPQTSSTPTYTVVPGESLWSITARLLPAGSGPEQIAQAWPVLYRANSDVVGADPSLIRPGTVLSVPDSLSAPSTTTGGQAPSR